MVSSPPLPSSVFAPGVAGDRVGLRRADHALDIGQRVAALAARGACGQVDGDRRGGILEACRVPAGAAAERVRAGAAQQDVVPAGAVERVVAAEAAQHVVARRAVERVAPAVPVIVQTDGAAWPAPLPPIASAAAIPTAAIAMRVRRVPPIRSLYGTARTTPART